MNDTHYPPDHSHYRDAFNEPLLPGSWAIDTSERNFGRLWRMQEESHVLYRFTENQAPIVMQRGQTPWLRKIVVPAIIPESGLHAWRAEFSKFGAKMWIEHPKGKPETFRLTAVTDAHHNWQYEIDIHLLQESPMPLLDAITAWLFCCLAAFKESLLRQSTGE